MATRLTRYAQLIFGSAAGSNQMAEVGSLAAGTPQTYSGATITPAIVQGLANYLGGWLSIVLGSNSPAIEDMNSVCYLYSYQLAYIMQMGIPEVDTSGSTSYFIGSLVQDGYGNIYRSISNLNLGANLTNTGYWVQQGDMKSVIAINPASTPTRNMTIADQGQTFLVNSANGPFSLLFTPPQKNFVFTIKDVGGVANLNPITISHTGFAGTIEGVSADYVFNSPGGKATFVCDGTNYWLI